MSSKDKKKVMVLDDDHDTLTLCSIILTAKGYQVITFDESSDIVSKVKKTAPDVIVMDNWIPDKGGIEATREIKKHPEFQNIPVIFFSANNEVHKLAEEAGAECYLAKPFDVEEFETLVEKMLR